MSASSSPPKKDQVAPLSFSEHCCATPPAMQQRGWQPNEEKRRGPSILFLRIPVMKCSFVSILHFHDLFLAM